LLTCWRRRCSTRVFEIVTLLNVLRCNDGQSSVAADFSGRRRPPRTWAACRARATSLHPRREPRHLPCA
jgi:hypothetical protein